VLGKFTSAELEYLEGVLNKTIQAVETYLQEGIDEAMNEFN
jgi:peptidyl-tRNA hydrolase